MKLFEGACQSVLDFICKGRTEIQREAESDNALAGDRPLPAACLSVAFAFLLGTHRDKEISYPGSRERKNVCLFNQRPADVRVWVM